MNVCYSFLRRCLLLCLFLGATGLLSAQQTEAEIRAEIANLEELMGRTDQSSAEYRKVQNLHTQLLSQLPNTPVRFTDMGAYVQFLKQGSLLATGTEARNNWESQLKLRRPIFENFAEEQTQMQRVLSQAEYDEWKSLAYSLPNYYLR